jgi:hypothetical protein
LKWKDAASKFAGAKRFMHELYEVKEKYMKRFLLTVRFGVMAICGSIMSLALPVWLLRVWMERRETEKLVGGLVGSVTLILLITFAVREAIRTRRQLNEPRESGQRMP